MESQFQFPYFFQLFSPLIILVALYFMISNRRSKKVPPGPRKLPIIGNIHNIMSPLPPHRTLHQLSLKYGPLIHLKLGQVNSIVVSSPEMAKQALKTHDIVFLNRPFSLAADVITYGSSDLVYAQYGDYWRQLRKHCILELLSVKRVQSFRPIREEEMKNFLRLISESEGIEINFTKTLYQYMFSVISRAAFGKIKKEHQAFFPYIKEIMEVAAGFSIADLFPSITILQRIGGLRARMERIRDQTAKIIEAIIEDHTAAREARGDNAHHNDDLVDVLLRLQQEGSVTLTPENIKAVILDVFTAGLETSSTTVEWAMSEMLKKPTTLRKAQEEIRQLFGEQGYVDEAGLEKITYLKLVIKEALRLHPPFPLLIPRASREDCEINGYKIPANTQLMVNAWAIGRNPQHWKQADEFIPERFADGTVDYKGFNFEFIPFGAGRRICPGMTFGLVNVELPLANMLFHFDWKLPGGIKNEDLDMTEAYGIAVKRQQDLTVIPVVAHPVM